MFQFELLGFRWLIAFLVCAFSCAVARPAGADEHESGDGEETVLQLDAGEYDPDNAEDINEICAACHGEFGQGGGDGTYPRLAGHPPDYIAGQLRAFKSRERINIPMFPFATERELPEDDIRDIAIFLSEIELLTKMPDVGDDVNSYEKLLLTKQVFNVARLDGDLEKGADLYAKNCKRCHGANGAGRGKTPPLAGQYIAYLQVQIDLFLNGERFHKSVDKLMRRLGEGDWRDLFAYLSSVDD